MTYLGKRKASTRGIRGVGVTLPSVWWRSMGIKVGDPLYIWGDFEDGALYIKRIPSPPQKHEEEEPEPYEKK